MALDSLFPPGPDGLNGIERSRKKLWEALHHLLPEKADVDVWQLTLDLTNAVPFALPPAPTTLTYAWSNGTILSTVDHEGGIPDDARERALLRALLVHTLTRLDELDTPMRTVTGSLLAMPCAETNHG